MMLKLKRGNHELPAQPSRNQNFEHEPSLICTNDNLSRIVIGPISVD